MRVPVRGPSLPSPRTAITALAGLSVVPALPWESAARMLVSVPVDVIARLGEGLDLLVAAAIVGSVAADAPALGLALSWATIALVVYQLLPQLYHGAEEPTSPVRGVRLLAACLTPLYGLMWRQIATDATAFGGPEATLVVLFGGFFGGGVAFALHLRFGTGGDPLRPGSPYIAYVERLTIEDVSAELKRHRELSDPWRRLALAGDYLVTGPLFALPALVAGLLGVLIHQYYPLPELAVAVGLVALKLDARREGGSLLERSSLQVDTRVMGSIRGATQNLKGTLMLVYCGQSGIVTAVIFAVILSNAASSAGSLVGALASTPITVVRLVPASVALIVLSVFGAPVMGVYSAVYWIRQMERIHPAAVAWGRRHGVDPSGDGDGAGAPLVARPPGVMLPFALYVALYAVVALRLVAEPGSEPFWPSLLALLAGLGLLAVAVWSLLWVSRTATPQLAATDARAVLLATVAVFSAVGIVIGLSPVPTAIHWLPWTATLVVMLAIPYFIPDVVAYAKRQRGPRRLAGSAYLLGTLVAMPALMTYLGVPARPVYGLFGVMAALYVLGRASTWYLLE